VGLVRQAALGVDDTPFWNLPVLAGGLLFSDAGYLNQLYNLGLARWSDGISVHPYDIHAAFGDPAQRWPAKEAARSFATGIPLLHRVMLNHGDSTSLWITEFGYATCPATPLCVDPQVQARWLVSAIATAARWRYVRAMVIFRLRDTGTDDNWEGRFGLLGLDGTPKPAFGAVSAEFSALP
jgi:hypothetical protein